MNRFAATQLCPVLRNCDERRRPPHRGQRRRYMNDALPPKLERTRLMPSAAPRRIVRPTSVEPVKLIFGWLRHGLRDTAGLLEVIIDHARGGRHVLGDLREHERRQRRLARRFRDDSATGRERDAELSRQHAREVPRRDQRARPTGCG